MTANLIAKTLVVVLVGLLAFTPNVAFAYLDPGTGSALIQGIIAAIAAVGLTLKVYWHRVLGFLGLRRSAEAEEKSSDKPEA